MSSLWDFYFYLIWLKGKNPDGFAPTVFPTVLKIPKVFIFVPTVFASVPTVFIFVPIGFLFVPTISVDLDKIADDCRAHTVAPKKIEDGKGQRGTKSPTGSAMCS